MFLNGLVSITYGIQLLGWLASLWLYSTSKSNQTSDVKACPLNKTANQYNRKTVFVLITNYKVNFITNDNYSIANFTLYYNSLFKHVFGIYGLF